MIISLERDKLKKKCTCHLSATVSWSLISDILLFGFVCSHKGPVELPKRYKM